MAHTPHVDSGKGKFPHTRWSLILEIQEGPDAERALGELCEIYWYPIYAFVRRSGLGPAEAEDATQGFVAHLLGRGHLSGVGPEKGKLRSYLLAGVKRFLKDERERAKAQKRGGGILPASIDAELAEERYQIEPADLETPERLFERRWALTVLERAMVALESEYEDRNQGERFQVLKPFLPKHATKRRYADAAKDLGMSEGAVQVAVHRLRDRYRLQLREEIAHTVASEEEVEEEIRHLFALFA